MTIAGLLGSFGKKKDDAKDKKADAEKGAPKREETVDYVESTNSRHSPFYGIRSYIDQFYEKRSPSQDYYEDIDAGHYLFPKVPEKKNIVYTCRAAFVIGIALLLIGAVSIMVGYLWPQSPPMSRTLADGTHFSITIIEDLRVLKVWKIVGLIVFSVGGFIIAISLLIPVCCRLRWEEAMFRGDREPPIEPIRIYPKISESITPPSARSPTEKKIPIMEEIKEIQPKTKEGSEHTQKREAADWLLDDE